MKLSKFTVNRPIFTTMITLIVILLGIVSLRNFSIDLLPDISYPTLSLITNYSNAGPQEIEEIITRPLEGALSAIPGLEQINSTSSEGVSSIRMSFAWGTDLSEASNDVRDRLDRVISRLPDEADRPMLRKFDVASFPIMMIGVAGDFDPIQLRRIIDEQISYRLERIDGVASVDIWGGLEREIHINIDPDKLKSFNISIDRIISSLRSANITQPAGRITRGNYDLILRTPHEFSSLSDIENTIIAVIDGSPVRLYQVSKINDSFRRLSRVVKIEGRPGIRLAINRQSGRNTVQVAEEVLAEIENINLDMPYITLTTIMDTSEFIKSSISNVSNAAVYGGILAIIILFFFLQNIRSTLIISLSIPISIIATFVVMYFGGYTLNIMTLGGLALGVGMLVDNSIVVLENIYRLRDTGMNIKEASIEGSEEVSAAITASTLTTLVIFVPLVFFEGMTGILFKQMASVVTFSLLSSLIIALAFVPMLSSVLLDNNNNINNENSGKNKNLKQHPKNQTKEKQNLFKTIIGFIEREYSILLNYCLNNRKKTIFGVLIILGLSLMLVSEIGVEFMPQTDEGEVRINVEMDIGTNLNRMEKTLEKVENIVRNSVPESKTMTSSAGGGGWRGGGNNRGDIRVALVPTNERSRTSQDIADDLRRKLSNIPGAVIRVRSSQGLFMLSRVMSAGGGTESFQIELRGYDFETGDALANIIKDIVEEVDGIADVRLSRELAQDENIIVIDRDRAADLHLTASQIANTIQTMISGSGAGFFREYGQEFRILLQLENAEFLSFDDILNLTVINSLGNSIALKNVVSLSQQPGPLRIERKDQERIINVSAEISGRDLISVVRDVRERLEGVPVPPGFSITFAGDYEEQQTAFRELLMGFILSFILVYMVMACQYESLKDPFIVMFSVPLSVIGIILMLFLTSTTFNVQSFMGVIMLGGIVVNNAIIIVDYTNILRRRDCYELLKAVKTASKRRFRPILMTASTTMLGLLPLALGLGEGGEIQASMARVVIGGLLSSTFITLVFIPVLYYVIEKKRGRFMLCSDKNVYPVEQV